jgi:Glycosyl hydrolase family 115/Gylcosyl hydrolase family 115 C-terminal domain
MKSYTIRLLQNSRLLYFAFFISISGISPVHAQTGVKVSFKKEAGYFPLADGRKATPIYVSPNDAEVVKIAARAFQGDMVAVTGITPAVNTDDKITGDVVLIAGTIGQSDIIDRLIADKKINPEAIKGKWETFSITVVKNPVKGVSQALVVLGSDSRGTAYGLFELSRAIGVSPWVWWADVLPEHHDAVYISATTFTSHPPSVQYRGIFLNDEDWGINPWSNNTFEPERKTSYPVEGHFKGAIGPKTYGKIFELLLRLRANTIWPAMHEVTMPFYFVEGNREMAEKYAIYIGSSHCEPLARNSATEWNLVGKGDYNYVTNRQNVLSYWEDRLKEIKNSNNIFTIGMRGKHDGTMEGVKTTEEYKNALTQVLADQSALLQKYINPDVSKIPQMLIPYKEVLDVYEAGLQVPDYVTLMWCDDNYGYITHFPDAAEQQRGGGNGVYYHLSYWGRPHDYLWLGTASPALLYQQMKLAYEKNSRKIWIANVGDIKPIEYQTTLFLDMAYDMDAAVKKDFLPGHMRTWLETAFGKPIAKELLPVMQEYYRLAYIRKPEYLGNTRTEEKDPKYNTVSDLPWSEDEIKDRLAAYEALSKTVSKAAQKIPGFQKNAFFELIQYPVDAATQMNKKMLYAQLARHGKAQWPQSDSAYNSIMSLTAKYNALGYHKWNGMMDYEPRHLPVFEPVKKEQATGQLPVYVQPLYTFNGGDYSDCTVTPETIEGLGYAGKAAVLKKGSALTYQLEELTADTVLVEVHLLPSHPVEGKQLRFTIEFDGTVVENVSYKTQGRSEEWKENVLRNQAIREFSFPVGKKSPHTLKITAIDEGVVIDQVKIYRK